MNLPYLIAGMLSIALGFTHSIMGEILIFQKKRKKRSLVPSRKSEGLSEGHLRIIWATWHLASVFGWGIGVILLRIAFLEHEWDQGFLDFLVGTFACSMLAGSVLVLVGTKGKHPGWIILLGIALLLFLSH